MYKTPARVIEIFRNGFDLLRYISAIKTNPASRKMMANRFALTSPSDDKEDKINSIDPVKIPSFVWILMDSPESASL